MIYEKLYERSVRSALKRKKQYLAKALEREERSYLRSVGIDDWPLEARKEAYHQEVLPFWERFGLRPKRFWFELSGSRDHVMDPRFLPADLYYTEIMPYINDGLQHPGLANKAYLDYLFSDVKQPQTVALRIEGTYYDDKRNIIGEEEAIGLCLERGERLFIKKSVDSSGGHGISVIDPSESTDEDVRKSFDDAGASFIVQCGIRQHPALDSINSLSVSTVRVLSLLLDGKVYIESAALRIGSTKRAYVKIHDDGYTVEILEDGRLHPMAYSDNGKWFENGNGIYDDSFRLPAMDKVYDEVRRIHPRMGHFKCIGWDFAIGQDGEPIMIEFNVFPMLASTQIARCKPIFNERTDQILEDYFIRRTWEKNHRQDVIIY